MEISLIPSFPLVSEVGESRDLKELIKGKVAFINFWYVPCPPCMMEMADLNQLFNRFSRNKNFTFVSITATDPEAIRNMQVESYADSSLYPFFKMAAKIDRIEYPVYYLVTCRDTVIRSGPRIIDLKLLQPDRINCPYDVLGFELYPTTYITNTKGEIIFRHTGRLTEINKSLNKAKKVLKEELSKLE